jgi:hypothetical protein
MLYTIACRSESRPTFELPPPRHDSYQVGFERRALLPALSYLATASEQAGARSGSFAKKIKHHFEPLRIRRPSRLERRRTTNDVMATPAPGRAPPACLPSPERIRAGAGRRPRYSWFVVVIVKRRRQPPGHDTQRCHDRRERARGGVDGQAGRQVDKARLARHAYAYTNRDGCVRAPTSPGSAPQSHHKQRALRRISLCLSKLVPRDPALRKPERGGPPWGRTILLDRPLRVVWKPIDDVVLYCIPSVYLRRPPPRSRASALRYSGLSQQRRLRPLGVLRREGMVARASLGRSSAPTNAGAPTCRADARSCSSGTPFVSRPPERLCSASPTWKLWY